MKKNKLFSVILSLSLVLTTAFIGAETVFADTSLEQSFDKAAMMKPAADPEDIVVQAVNMNGTEKPTPYSTASYKYGTIAYVKVHVPKAGSLQVAVMASENTTVGLYESYESIEAAAPLGSAYIQKAVTDEDIEMYTQQVSKAGTYYLVFSTTSYNPAQSAFAAGYIPDIASGASVSVKSGKTYYASVTGSGNRYYKITTPGTRYLTISFPDRLNTSASYKVKVMNSTKKKNLYSKVVSVSSGRDYTTYIGVPKGTYYIAVSTAEKCYGINVKSTSVKENSGSKKSTAKGILKGSSKSGIITASQSSSSGDWYKFKTTSAQLVEFSIDTKSGGYSGGIRATFYDAKGSIGSADYYYGRPSGRPSPYTLGMGKRLAPGTYYIKISKYGSGSGYYKLKWL